MRSRLVLTIALAALTLFAMPLFAAEDGVSIGSVSTVDGVKLSVSVSAAGSILLSTPTNPQYVDRSFMNSLAGYLGSIATEMQALQARTLLGRDYVDIGRLQFGNGGTAGRDGLAFRFDIDSTAKDKVLLRVSSTIAREPLLFSQDGVNQLKDLALKAMQYVDALKDQKTYLTSMSERLVEAAGRTM